MNIYVGNLSQETTEADLQETFEAFGQVSSAKIVKDRISSESKGFGFVEMPEKAEAKEAIAGLNGKDLKGQSLVVNEARERREGARGGGNQSFSEHGKAWRTQVFVNNDVDAALRMLKKKLSEDGDHRRLKERKSFTPRSERKRRKAVKARRRRRK